jgi:hypothetical protein
MRARPISARTATAQLAIASTARPCMAAGRKPADMKSLQSDKIKEIGEALLASGLVTLDQQATALGLSRSTAWTVLNARHKASGLSAIVINQMLMAPQLPPLVRAKLFEYIEEKITGSFGHSPLQVRRFAARLAAERLRFGRKIAAQRSTAKMPSPRFEPLSQERPDLPELPDTQVGPHRLRQYAFRRSSSR